MILNPAEWSMVRAVFEASLDLPTIERSEFLLSRLGHSQKLLDAAKGLLVAAGEMDDFLERPLVDFSSPGKEVMPSRLGGYRVLALLGEGGMGRVYLVDRPEQDFLPAMALKVIKADLVGVKPLRRFHSERRILGALEHPYIARMLDGGVTDEGLPFFVMEHVDGKRIDCFVQGQHLPCRQLIALFLSVCRAVAYAHQHLVVHCDLKPSNILVTADGTPKLLDFGVARLLYEQPHEIGLALTPQFASPEQIQGLEITTATDVFSLGLLLACLLGVPITHGSTPSSSGSAHQERPALNPGDLRHLHSDLEAILVKCLQESPQDRYSSVEQLATDLERHLTCRPVRARNPTPAYRFRRFMQRNRWPVLAVATLCTAIVTGTITTARQTVVAQREKQRAEARTEELRTLASSLLLDTDESLRELAGAEPAREQLLLKAYEHLVHLGQDSGNLFQLADLNDQIGDLLRLRYRVGEGNPQEALDRYQQALRIWEQLLAQSPDSRPLQERVARSHWHIARNLGQLGRHPEHLQRARLAVTLQKRLLVEEPERADLWRQLASYLQTLGTAEANQAELPLAQAHFERVIALRRAMQGKNRAVQFELGSALRNLALVRLFKGELKEAVALLEEALKGAENTHRLEPRSLRALSDLQLTHQRMGQVLSRLGRPEAVVRNHFLKAIYFHQELIEANSRNLEIRLRGAEAYQYFGIDLCQRRRPGAALIQLEKSLQLLEGMDSQRPSNIHISIVLAETCQALAKVEDALVPGQGQPHRQRALAILEELRTTQRLAPRYFATLAKIRQECEAAG